MDNRDFNDAAMRKKTEKFKLEESLWLDPADCKRFFARAERQQQRQQIRAQQASNGQTVIRIDSPIGQGANELSAKWLRSQLPIDGKDIVLQVHCEGGAVFEALAMMDVLAAYRGQKRAVVSSMALSAASLLLTACDQVEVTPNAYVMLHNSHMDDVDMSDSDRELLDSLNARMVQLYAAKSRLPASKIRTMMDSETFLDAAESVRLGFADRVVSPSNMRIVARSIPSRIVAKIKSPAQTAVAKWSAAVQACGSVIQADKSHPGLRLKMLAEVNAR